MRAGVRLLASFALTASFVSVVKAEASELDPTIGYNYSEIETARHAATGGAQRALSTSVGALFVNPANIAIGQLYHLGGFVQLWPEAQRQSYGIAASDSIMSSSGLAGAAGATYNIQDSDGVDRKWTDVRFALAFPFTPQLFVGLGGRYEMLKQNGLGPLGASVASGGLQDQQIINGFSFDAGATFKPTPELALSLVGTNLTNPGHGFLPTTFGGGLGYGTTQFAVEADVVADFTTWEETSLRAMLGLEALFGGSFAVRGGYRLDRGAESHGLGFGVGYVDRAFVADVGVRRVVSGDTSTTVVFGFTYHLEATGLTPTPGDTF